MHLNSVHRRYLETGGEGAVVRPWTWIVLISAFSTHIIPFRLFTVLCMYVALGGVFAPALIKHIYFFLAENALARTQALLNALVFDHALRLRVLAGGGVRVGSKTDVHIDMSAPNFEHEPVVQESGLMGKINDLVSSDLDNVYGASDFLIACKFFFSPHYTAIPTFAQGHPSRASSRCF
jgi:hypothetical protein